MPKVLISDALSPAAVQIFKDRGVETDFQPNLGKDKDKLAELIGQFDGLAIRSATKVTPAILAAALFLWASWQGIGGQVESSGDRVPVAVAVAVCVDVGVYVTGVRVKRGVPRRPGGVG